MSDGPPSGDGRAPIGQGAPRSSERPVVSILTDYGLADGFVGVVHSVLRRRAPGCDLVDLTHGVRRQDVRAGALALVRAAPYLADGVVLAVVDPGVGTARRAVAVARPRGASALPAGAGPDVAFVAPDNGLVVPTLDALGGAWEAVELDDTGYWLDGPGPTFAGRDIFAPAAALLANGRRLGELGQGVPVDSLFRLPAPVNRRDPDGTLHSEVTWVDRYGNVQLAAMGVAERGSDLFGTGQVTVTVGGGHGGAGEGRYVARAATTFADLAPGRLGVIVDSCGHLALCLAAASAADATCLQEADTVTLMP